jgi:flagellar biosynthesis GTPase FlhF
MNLVGKIFTVLILVMALVFMAFAVAVYATHKNWRDIVMLPRDQAKGGQAAGLKYQLEDARARNKDLKDRRDNMEEELAKEQLAARNALLKLKEEYKKQQADNAALQEELKTVNQEKLQAITSLGTQQQTNLKLRGEVDKLREEIRQAQKERDDKMAELIAATDQRLQLENELRRAKDLQTRTAADLAKALEVCRRFKLNPDPAAYVNADVDGVVTAVQGTGLIEISLGSDDGLNKGAYLRIFRADGSMYLGRAQVLQTAPDKSVCKVIERKGAITKGDRVSSGINDK